MVSKNSDKPGKYVMAYQVPYEYQGLRYVHSDDKASLEKLQRELTSIWKERGEIQFWWYVRE